VELVKLLAGRFNLSSNMRSRGGYTPLMMAGMGKCYEVSNKEQGWIHSPHNGQHGEVLRGE